jgi:hypothetical protein
VATIYDGRTTVPMSDGYALILPDLAKMTPFTREAINPQAQRLRVRTYKPCLHESASILELSLLYQSV